MTPGYRLLPAADKDLDDLADYLAREAGRETALRFYDAAATTCAELARMPGMGERHDSRNPRLADVRTWRIGGFENHLIFYRPNGGEIEIIRILHAARDLRRILDEDEP